MVVLARGLAEKNGLRGAPPEIVAVYLCVSNYLPIFLFPPLLLYYNYLYPI